VIHRFPLCLVLLAAGFSMPVSGQEKPAEGPQAVIIERKPVQLIPADEYRFSVRLQPLQQVTLTAAMDGVIRAVPAQIGQAVEPQFELASFDNERLKLESRRARAALSLADAELRQARAGGNPGQIELAEARQAIAQADIALVNHDEGQTSVRAPYSGTVQRVYVQPGQLVRKGDPIVSFANLARLVCEVPVDRDALADMRELTLTVEDREVTGELKAIVPLDESMDHLRDLAVSVALAVVSVRNETGQLAPGQTVFPALLPDHPVTRVPLESVLTADSGGRVVVVLRNNVVRHIPVTLHGQVGRLEVFVSGPFMAQDEVVSKSSIPLADATVVRSTSMDRTGTAQATGAAAPGRSPVQAPRSGAAGF